MTNRVLLEGRPGVGKSTVARRLVELLRERGVAVRGFVTHEMRESGRRVGFVVETSTGDRATLAHVSFPGPPRVGRYGVDLESFERVVLPLLDVAGDDDVFVIDELGKMELASSAFRDAVDRVFAGAASVVATVHTFRHPMTDALKQRADVEVVAVRAGTRDELPERLACRFAGGPRGRSRSREVMTVATPKQRRAAKQNIQKAQRAAKRNRTIAKLPASTRRDLGRQAARARQRGGKAGHALEDRNRQQLYEVAKKKGIRGRSKMGKWELIEAIRAASRR